MTQTGQKGMALAELRARTALRAAGLDPSVPLIPASSVTNEVWLAPEHVVRVNRTHDSRLAREAIIAAVLPDDVGYPKLVAHGHQASEDWIVSVRAPGTPLAHHWPDLTFVERYQAIAQLAIRLRALHDTPAPPDLPPLHGAPQLLEVGAADATKKLHEAIEQVARLPHVEPLLAREAAEMVAAMASALEPFDAPTLVHGDMTFENVLWHEGEVTAVLDVEWSRPGPRDIDLDIILRCCAYPELHVAEAYEARTKAADYRDVPGWLREEYSRLFAYPRLRERLRVFAIAFEVRQLLALPPSGPPETIHPAHAYHRLARLVHFQSYLDT